MPNLAALVLAIAIVALVLEMLRRKKFREKYATLWLVIGALTVVLAAFPQLLSVASDLLGIQLPSTLLFLMSILLLLGVCLHLSWELSVIEDETRTLAEEVAILRTQIEAITHNATPAEPQKRDGE